MLNSWAYRFLLAMCSHLQAKMAVTETTFLFYFTLSETLLLQTLPLSMMIWYWVFRDQEPCEWRKQRVDTGTRSVFTEKQIRRGKARVMFTSPLSFLSYTSILVFKFIISLALFACSFCLESNQCFIGICTYTRTFSKLSLMCLNMWITVLLCYLQEDGEMLLWTVGSIHIHTQYLTMQFSELVKTLF
jgi:hypothetical protein